MLRMKGTDNYLHAHSSFMLLWHCQNGACGQHIQSHQKHVLIACLGCFPSPSCRAGYYSGREDATACGCIVSEFKGSCVTARYSLICLRCTFEVCTTSGLVDDINDFCWPVIFLINDIGKIRSSAFSNCLNHTSFFIESSPVI